jgi:hypothetical protein
LQETFYLEELVRWMLQRGRVFGILHLQDDGISRPSPEGAQSYSVSVRGLFAVAEAGSIIEIPDDPRLSLRGNIEATTPTVPLFVGVSRAEKAREPEFHSSLDTGLMQCGGLRRKYVLSADNSDANIDWLQIAQFEKTTTGLGPDPYFIPECMFLSSCALLWQTQKEIQTLARQLLAQLEQLSAKELTTATLPLYSAAMTLAGSLGPAARMVDDNLNPRAYADRLVGVLASQRGQLGALPNPNLSSYHQALEQLDATLNYFEGEWTMGQAMGQIKTCFERLLRLFPELLAKLGNVSAPVERREVGHDDVVPKTPETQMNVTRTSKPLNPWRR